MSIKEEIKKECPMLYSELLDQGLKYNDVCDGCGNKVLQHARSTINTNPITTRNEYDPFKSFTFPILSKSSTMVPLFLQQLENELVLHGINETYYPRSLMGVTKEVAAQNWIKTNILNKKLTWNEAKEVFTDHFQSSDFKNQLQWRWKNIKQKVNESVQDYVDRFQTLGEQLGLIGNEEVEAQTITNFLLNLHENIYTKYNEDVNIMRRIAEKAGNEYKEDSLREIMDACIRIDVNRLTGIHHQSNVNKLSNRTTTSTKQTTNTNKVCTFHPLSNNHSSAECRFNPINRLSTNTNTNTNTSVTTSIQQQPSNSNSSASTIRCFKCNEVGHVSSRCNNNSNGTSSAINKPITNATTNTTTNNTAIPTRTSDRFTTNKYSTSNIKTNAIDLEEENKY